MTEADLLLVLGWRNHPEIRRYMRTQHEISFDEHRRWFERASQEATRHLLIAEEGDTPIGYVHFSGAAPGSIAEWGFYVAPGAPKGSGRKLGSAALDYTFATTRLHKVCGQALDFNQSSIRFHQALGFRQEGVLRDQCRIGDTYHDLICFGLLCHEWPGANQG